MSNKIRIEQYDEKYRDAVIELISSIQQREFGIHITPKDQPDLKRIQEFYQTKNGNFWIAMDGEQVVGSVGLLDIGNQQTALRKMFVRQDYRGSEKGIARRLLSVLLNWAKENDVKEIFLGTTAQFLAAHRFYGKHGFSEIPKATLPLSFPVMEVDSKFYKYRV